jgi:hypothetical protein
LLANLRDGTLARLDGIAWEHSTKGHASRIDRSTMIGYSCLTLAEFPLP